MAGFKRCSNLLITISIMVFIPTSFGQSACPCGSQSVATIGTSTYLTSPNYPTYYPNDCNCTWVITAASSSEVVVLNVLELSLETSSVACPYDYVTLYDGSNIHVNTILKFCNEPTNKQFVSTGSSMTVTFRSDSSGNNRGFKFEFTSKTKSALCGNAALSATSTMKVFSSPGYNYKYPNDMYCQWTITADSYLQVVVLNVLNMNLEGTPPCAYDYLSLYDGNSNSSSNIQTLCGGQVTSSQFASTGSFMTVVFHSDGSSNYKGFQFQYGSSDPSATCGTTSNLVATGTTKYLSSPNYPFNYPNNMNCQWIISTTGLSKVVLLRVVAFSLEATSSTCNFDNVTIHNGYGTTAPVIRTMCGSVSTTQISSSGNYMTVVFRSDSSTTSTGFRFEYTSQDSSDVCSSSSLTAYSYAQYITSPNYPSNYLINTDCTWVIRASSSSQVILLKLIDFNLEGVSTSCYNAYDYVTIYDGSSTSSTSLQKMCGTQTTLEFVSTGSSMTVSFHSDGTNNYRGFKLQYTSSAKSDVCSAQSLTAYSSTSYLASPNYPGIYPNNMNCEWHISASLYSDVVVLELISFSLEGSGSPCFNDYVNVYDGSSKYSDQIASLCGSKYSGTYTSSGSDMTVVFRSDSSIQNSGFRFSYHSTEKSVSSSLSAGAIVGIVICCIAVPCIIVAIIILYRKHITQQQIRNNPNRFPVQNARTTTAAPAVSYVANNPPAVPAPYMMQNPPQTMPMGTPYNTNYLPPPYSYAMQPGMAPQGPSPFGAPGPSFVGAASPQDNGGHINKGFNGESAPTVPS